MYLAEISPVSLRGAVFHKFAKKILTKIITEIIMKICIKYIILCMIKVNNDNSLQLGTVYQLIITMSILLSQVSSYKSNDNDHNHVHNSFLVIMIIGLFI